jgi:hypothetical protein
VLDHLAAMRASAVNNGLVYDPSCWGATIEVLRRDECDARFDEDDDDCAAPCRPWHGQREIDEYCSYDEFGLTDCAQGLVCAPKFCEEGDCPSVCHDPCARSQAGERCRDVPCADGLACDVEEDTCVTAPALGEPCVSGGGCGEGRRCDDATDTCVSGSEEEPQGALPGEPCTGHSQCLSGMCPAGYCTALPGEGEPCTNACEEGLVCDDATSLCGPPPSALCTDDPL